MKTELYPPEYRKTRCLVCSEPLVNHHRHTAESIAATQGATYDKPVTGYRAPLSPTLVGQWLSHEPTPWSIASGGPTLEEFNPKTAGFNVVKPMSPHERAAFDGHPDTV